MTVEAWNQQARKVASSGEFGSLRIKPPETVGDSLVLHVVDPSGVLLVFVQRCQAVRSNSRTNEEQLI